MKEENRVRIMTLKKSNKGTRLKGLLGMNRIMVRGIAKVTVRKGDGLPFCRGIMLAEGENWLFIAKLPRKPYFSGLLADWKS
jgi:hypothetical protein